MTNGIEFLIRQGDTTVDVHAEWYVGRTKQLISHRKCDWQKLWYFIPESLSLKRVEAEIVKKPFFSQSDHKSWGTTLPRIALIGKMWGGYVERTEWNRAISKQVESRADYGEGKGECVSFKFQTTRAAKHITVILNKVPLTSEMGGGILKGHDRSDLLSRANSCSVVSVVKFPS